MPKLQPFEIFNIEINFNIDHISLMKKFAELQKQHHPDLPNSNQSKALDITNAFEILKNEIKRGQAILEAFEIDMNSVQIPQDFFVLIIDCEAKEARKMYNTQKEILYNFGNINKNNVAIFAVEFLKYKYLKSKLF